MNLLFALRRWRKCWRSRRRIWTVLICPETATSLPTNRHFVAVFDANDEQLPEWQGYKSRLGLSVLLLCIPGEAVVRVPVGTEL